MDLKTDPSKPGLKVKETVAALFKAAGEAAYFNGGGTIAGLIDAASAFGHEAASAEQSAHTFWRSVMAYAIMDVVGRNKVADPQKDAHVIDRAIDQFGPYMRESVAYDAACLEEPTNFGPYQKLRTDFCGMMIAIRPDRNFDKLVLQRQLDHAMREATAKVWQDKKTSVFRAYIQDTLSGPVFKGAERRQAWQRHYSWIDSHLSKKPLFGQEDTGITLRDVYVPLRCNFHEEIEVTTPEARRFEQSVPRIANVGWLHETLHAWLNALPSNSRDTLRIVAGAPGSGKSVFSRTFAYDVAIEAKWNVAFVELQHMAFKNDFRDRILGYFKPAADGAGLGDDIFEMMDVEGTPPTLFVFDGLDELSRSDDAAKDVSKKFLRDVKSLLSELNRNGLRAAAVVLGRSTSVEEARKEADMSLSTLLHVMPLKVLDHSTLGVREPRSDAGSEEKFCNDPNQLAQNDDRQVFWQKWIAANGLPSGLEAEAIKNEQLDDLTAEPLLFYLLVLSGFADKDAAKAADNRNHVYREIFRRVHKRDKGKSKTHPASHGLNKKDFFHLMECLGLAIWQGGGRTGSKSDFDSFRGLHSYDRYDEFETKEFAKLKNVALQFYTRAIEDTDQGFEFVHKSFGEYLSACAILRSAKELSYKYHLHDDFCPKWLRLFGAQPVTPEIFKFLSDEARLFDVSQLKTMKVKLEKQMNWVMEHGFPAHKIGDKSWRTAETYQRNATGALLCVLSVVARSIFEHKERAEGCQAIAEGDLVKLKLSDQKSVRRLVEMLYITHDYTTAYRQALSFIDMSSVNENGNDLMCLNLNGSSFCYTDLKHANLSRANLNNVEMLCANLIDTILAQSISIHGDWQTCSMTNTQLMESRFFFCSMKGADLSSSNATGTNFWYTDLSETNLCRAVFLNTSFEGCNLADADFSLALIASANFERVENLTQEQLNSAFGDSYTTLPVGFERPEHWTEDLLDSGELFALWSKWRRTHKNINENKEYEAED